MGDADGAVVIRAVLTSRTSGHPQRTRIVTRTVQISRHQARGLLLRKIEKIRTFPT